MPEETLLQSKVPTHQAGKFLLDYLCARFKYQAKEVWLELILKGKVTVNGKPARPYQPLKSRDLIAYSVVLQEPPVDKTIEIIHAEEGFLVATKSGQLPSHADGNFIKNTFIYLITQKLREEGWKGDVKLVHRLDRETSGLMVVGKKRDIHLNLSRQFESGTIEKEYLAVVKGPIADETFEVKGAMGRDESSQISVRQKALPDGSPFSKPAWTRFEKIKDLKGAALLRCFPKTGRTNQIRVHLDSIGHPVIGDKLYGKSDEEFLAFIRHVKSGGDPSFPGHAETPRHLLHASKLVLDHPETGGRLVFEADLPEDMKNYIAEHSLG